MSTQRLTPPAGSLVSIYDVEHPRSITRRIQRCLTVAGIVAAVGGLALGFAPPASLDLT